MAPARENAAIRLAYIHNFGDTYVSVAPVAAGILVLVTGSSLADPLIALLTALWIAVSTLREVVVSREKLLWPEKISCGHPREPSGKASSPVLRAYRLNAEA